MNNIALTINEALAQRLISIQFPQWKNLSIRSVATPGWDNKTYHLGDDMLIRLPSAAKNATSVEKEQLWLPKLAPCLPLQISTPVVMGKPSSDFPFAWSIYRWIEGKNAGVATIDDLNCQ